MSFYVPATEFQKHICDSPVWKLGNVGRKSAASGGLLAREGSEEGEEGGGEAGGVANGEVENEDDEFDGPEKFLLRTQYLTDPESRGTEGLKEWASSAPEMKDVS